MANGKKNKRHNASIGGGVAATSPEARRRDLGSGSAAPAVISPEALRKGQMEVHPNLRRGLGSGSTGTPTTRSPEARRVMEAIFDYVGPWHPLNSNRGWSLSSDWSLNSPSVSEYAFGSAGAGANPERFRTGAPTSFWGGNLGNLGPGSTAPDWRYRGEVGYFSPAREQYTSPEALRGPTGSGSTAWTEGADRTSGKPGRMTRDGWVQGTGNYGRGQQVLPGDTPPPVILPAPAIEDPNFWGELWSSMWGPISRTPDNVIGGIRRYGRDPHPEHGRPETQDQYGYWVDPSGVHRDQGGSRFTEWPAGRPASQGGYTDGFDNEPLFYDGQQVFWNAGPVDHDLRRPGTGYSNPNYSDPAGYPSSYIYRDDVRTSQEYLNQLMQSMDRQAAINRFREGLFGYGR